ncbi:MAG TPA: ATP-binding protein [Candidatus Aquilonibacter sp.]|nr:ATP-binding protein [Candidatus Aquilonibacter sp.]
MPNSLNGDYRVLVLAPFGKDALLVREVLERSGIPVGVVEAASAVARCVGGGAGAAIVAEEALDEEAIECLSRAVSAQPAWSDFPIIVLTGGGATTPYTEMMVRSRTPMGNINLIERPLRPATLVSSVRTAIRSRLRQYEIRNHLEERARAEDELQLAHDQLESLVEKRTLALRKLSAKIMRVQDEERRRIARELHDGLGQWLAAAQINLDIEIIHSGTRPSSVLQETRKLVDHAVTSIRTMSYLLHPPLLDEAGFEAAAHWFIDGFAKRTGMSIHTNFVRPSEEANPVPKNSRMPEVVELALFRALQEGLINAHRHSGSPNVEVKFERLPEVASLEIQDFGHGIPQAVMERFERTGTGSGVGLAGIRERVKELGGDFKICSGASGTRLLSTVPLTKAASEHESNRSQTASTRDKPGTPVGSSIGGMF